MRALIGVCSCCQFLLWLFLFGSPYPEEVPPRVMMLAGAMLAGLVAAGAKPMRWFAIGAALFNLSAIAACCLLPAIYGGEFVEGFILVVMSGIIFLMVGPAALNIALLASLAIFQSQGAERGGAKQNTVADRPRE
jgi:hypothetical protein